MVQPRRPSMFAPTMSRPEPADLPALDSMAPHDDATLTPAAFVRPGDHGGKVLTQPDQQEGRQPVPGSRVASHPAVRLRRAESDPVTKAQHTSAVDKPSARDVLHAPHADSTTIHEQVSHRQMSPDRQTIQDPVDAAPDLSAARIEPPPRLVQTRPDMPRPSASAPPSLASGRVSGRRTEQNHAGPVEPPVEVTIGRIEVTAVSAAPDVKRKSGSRRPAMSLEEYLTRRQGGRT